MDHVAGKEAYSLIDGFSGRIPPGPPEEDNKKTPFAI